jgi:hypothetical protein
VRQPPLEDLNKCSSLRRSPRQHGGRPQPPAFPPQAASGGRRQRRPIGRRRRPAAELKLTQLAFRHSLLSLPPPSFSRPITSSPFTAAGSRSRIQPSPRWIQGPVGRICCRARVEVASAAVAACPRALCPRWLGWGAPPLPTSLWVLCLGWPGSMAARHRRNNPRGDMPQVAGALGCVPPPLWARGCRRHRRRPSGCCAPGGLGCRGPWSHRRSPRAGVRLMPSSWGLVADRMSASTAAPSGCGLGRVPVGSPALWRHLSAFGFGMGIGWRQKSMMAKSSRVVHLLGGVILSPYSLLSGGCSG